MFAFVACALARRGNRTQRILNRWAGGDEGLVCLSVRSGFDLLLEALELEPGDEVAMSALTHPDMVRIVEAHGLRAVPIDIDTETLGPRPDHLESALTERSRIVVIAHLFGGRVDLEPLAALARPRGIVVVEDCAQSYRGPTYAGDRLADVSMFSFGTIKTATALGGGLVRVRDPKLRARMAVIQSGWPLQPRREYARRAIKTGGLCMLSKPRVYRAFSNVLGLLRRDLDTTVTRAVRGFPGADLVPRIRRRPSAPLLALLERRLRHFDQVRLDERTQLGERVAASVAPPFDHPGRKALDRTHWVFPILTDDPRGLAQSLRKAGLDASTATSSVVSVPPSPSGQAPSCAEDTVARVVFAPVYPELDESAVDRLLGVISRSDRSSVVHQTAPT